jgi:hypothetical protein
MFVNYKLFMWSHGQLVIKDQMGRFWSYKSSFDSPYHFFIHCVSPGCFRLTILLPPPPECWNYKCAPPQVDFGTISAIQDLSWKNYTYIIVSTFTYWGMALLASTLLLCSKYNPSMSLKQSHICSQNSCNIVP